MSYIIESNPNTVFIHIPKTAGASILKLINQNYKYQTITNSRTRYTNYHSTLDDASNFLQSSSDYYIFTVVRNPWSRACSWFYFRKEVLRQGLKAIYAGKHTKKVIENFDLINNEYQIMNDDFNSWLKLYYNSNWDHTWFSLNDTQSSWIKNNNFSIDNIIKFENIEKEIKEIPIFKDKILPHYNSSPIKYDYTNMYNLESKKLIDKIYQEDIDTFKYTFN